MASFCKSQETKASKKNYSFDKYSLVHSGSEKMAANQRIVINVYSIDDANRYNCFQFYNNYRTKLQPIFFAK